MPSDKSIRFISIIDQPRMTAVKVVLFDRFVETPPTVGDVAEMSNIYRYHRDTHRNITEVSLGTKISTNVTVSVLCIIFFS